MANETILIVDDNELDVKLARDVLCYHGFVTLEACTAAEGIAIALECAPDLILMDVSLPDADGVEALATLRADPRSATIPIVALTARAMPDDKRLLLAAGFQGYISKPIEVVDLPEQVRLILAPQTEKAPCSRGRASS